MQIKIFERDYLPLENCEWNFIYNRFDLFLKENVICIVAETHDNTYFVQGYINNDTIKLGLWLNPVPLNVLTKLNRYLFKKYHVKKISAEFYNQNISKMESLFKKLYVNRTNHWKLVLPNSEDELLMRMDHKFRHNIGREQRIVNDSFKTNIEEYEGNNIPSSLIEEYFKLKYQTHNHDYEISAKSYLEKYHVTNAYVLKLNNKIGSILLSCEQTNTVYLENLTYNLEFSKYSLGKILYLHFLKEIINKSKKCLYLSSGKQIYKSWYGGIEEKVLSFTAYRTSFAYIIEGFKKVNRKIFKKLNYKRHNK